MDLVNRYRPIENKKAAYAAAFRLTFILYRTSLDDDLGAGLPKSLSNCMMLKRICN